MNPFTMTLLRTGSPAQQEAGCQERRTEREAEDIGRREGPVVFTISILKDNCCFDTRTDSSDSGTRGIVPIISWFDGESTSLKLHLELTPQTARQSCQTLNQRETRTSPTNHIPSALISSAIPIHGRVEQHKVTESTHTLPSRQCHPAPNLSRPE